MLRPIALAATLAITVPASAGEAYLGETFDCQFPKAGHVVINTREPGASVTWHGKRYAVSGGSYFYNTEDGRLAVYFGPKMKWWNFGNGRDRAVCSRHKNRR